MAGVSQARPEAHAPRPGGGGQEEMIVDLFAGGGGASTGIFMATGRHPDVAVNHDPEAVALHAMNHPSTRHYCCDVFEVDPVEACSDAHGNLRPVGLLWASPDCTHHSKARGGKPADKNIRALAWVVTKWASKVRPRCIFLENVEEFQDWCDLDENGRPDTSQKGAIYRLWKSQFEAMGYQVEAKVSSAADVGTPTTRKRLAVIMRCDGRPLQWPVQTHAQKSRLKSPGLFDPPMKPWRSAAQDVIDWSIPCPSIFGRKKTLAPKTQVRIAKGIKRFVIEAAEPFIVPITHAGQRPNHDINEPLKTVTSANRGELGLATVHVTKFGENTIGTDPSDPLDTVMAGAPRHGVVAAHLTKFRNGSSGSSLEEPMPTVTANSFVKRPGCGVPLGVVAAHLTRHFGQSVGSDATEPTGTIMPNGGGKTSVTAAYLGRQFGTAVGRDPVEPHPTVMADGAGGKSFIAAACMTAYYGNSVGSAIDEPLPTAVTKDRHAPAVAFMEQANTGVIGHAADAPVSTILAAGCHQRPVECEIAPASPDADTRRNHVLAFLQKHFGAPTEAEAADPAATLMGRLRHGLVLIGKAVWQIADIGLRMLTPRELYNAQGFPRDYIIDHTAKGPLTKTAQTRMAGNSVCPPWAAAIIAANDPLLQRQAAVG